MTISLEQGSDLLQRSQGMVSQAVGRGTTLLADRVEHYINLAREIGDVLRERNEPQAAQFVQTLAERATDISRYLRNADGARLWGDAQEFAQDKTWLLAGAGLMGGLAIARTVRTAAAGSDISDNGGEYRDSYAQSTDLTASRSSYGATTYARNTAETGTRTGIPASGYR